MAAAIGPLSKQGFGCMGMSAFYTSARTTSEESNINVFRTALTNGVTVFNTATFYGPLNVDGYGANLKLIRKCIEGLDRSSFVLTGTYFKFITNTTYMSHILYTNMPHLVFYVLFSMSVYLIERIFIIHYSYT
jgi:aryl-alcohol dehydrogenase-like predicted oxidoreductase